MLCWSSREEISHAQGKRNPSKMVGVARGHQRKDTLKPYSQKTCQSNHTRTTALSNSMKPSHACRATQDAWVYLWAFYIVPLVYISVFVYCFDDCSFEVRFRLSQMKPDSSSSVLLSQDCFGYLGSFVFPYEL